MNITLTQSAQGQGTRTEEFNTSNPITKDFMIGILVTLKMMGGTATALGEHFVEIHVENNPAFNHLHRMLSDMESKNPA